MKSTLKPTLKHFVITALPFSIILIGIFSVSNFPTLSFPVIYVLDNTTLKWLLSYFFLIMFFYSNRYFFDAENNKEIRVITYFLIWTAIGILRGMFVAENYWDWKGLLTNVMGLLLPVVAYSATNRIIVSSILSTYIKYGLPLFLILFLLIQTDAYGFYLMPISFLLLFIPALTKKQRILLLVGVAVVFLSDLGARSNVIKFATPLLFLILYYFRNIVTNKMFNTIRLVLIITPFVFFSLAVTDVFNVFNINDYLGELSSKGTDIEGNREMVDLSEDTRTFLYVEVLESAIRNDYWIFGRTPARGNDSQTFGLIEYELTGRDERLANEVGILNVFTWFGLIGVFLYLLVFLRASYLAINRSENIYAKILGVYVAFRWLFAWVEDVNNLSLNYFMLWIIIGLCFSYSFRNMTNYEVTIWIRSVFDYRYFNFEHYLKKEKNER